MAAPTKSRVTSQRRLFHLISQMNFKLAAKMMASVGTMEVLSSLKPGRAVVKTILPGTGQQSPGDDLGWQELAPPPDGNGPYGPLRNEYYNAVENTIPIHVDFPDDFFEPLED